MGADEQGDTVSKCQVAKHTRSRCLCKYRFAKAESKKSGKSVRAVKFSVNLYLFDSCKHFYDFGSRSLCLLRCRLSLLKGTYSAIGTEVIRFSSCLFILPGMTSSKNARLWATFVNE